MNLTIGYKNGMIIIFTKKKMNIFLTVAAMLLKLKILNMINLIINFTGGAPLLQSFAWIFTIIGAICTIIGTVYLLRSKNKSME